MESLFVHSLYVGTFILIASLLVFIIARLAKDNSVMDIAYGPIYFFAIGGTLLHTMNFASLPTIVTACMAIWATRLGVRIFLKNKGTPEDARYAAWRAEWMQKGVWYFWLRSFLQINLLQGVIIFIVALPGTIALAHSAEAQLDFALLGLLVFLFGLAYETTADWQLDRFIARKKAGTEPANLMTTGLFRYSRRPNYFGETMVWWGLAIMVLPLPFGWLALLSPLTITYIVTKVTGPMLEKIFLEKYPEEYAKYQQTTSYLIPLPPKHD